MFRMDVCLGAMVVPVDKNWQSSWDVKGTKQLVHDLLIPFCVAGDGLLRCKIYQAHIYKNYSIGMLHPKAWSQTGDTNPSECPSEPDPRIPSHGGCFPIELGGPFIEAISLAFAYTHHPTQPVIDVSRAVAILVLFMQIGQTIRLYVSWHSTIKCFIGWWFGSVVWNSRDSLEFQKRGPRPPSQDPSSDPKTPVESIHSY